MISKDDHIMVWNCFTDVNDEHRLSPDELYLWCYLYTIRMYDDTILTQIDLLDQFMNIKLYSSRQHINKDKIKLAFEGLIFKNAIYVLDENKDVSKGTRISLQCWTNKDKRYDKDKHFNGYEKLLYSELNSVTDIIDFYIWFSVKRFDSLGGRDCSDEEWATLLGVSESTARRRVKKLVDSKVIYKKSGKWENEKKQGKNKYKTEPFDENVLENEDIIDEIEEDLSIFEISIERKLENVQWGNWKDGKAYLNEDDFYLYWLQYDNVDVRKVCEERIRKTTNSKTEDKFKEWSELGNVRANIYWNKRKEENIINAVKYDDITLYLNKDNVDRVNWDKVKVIYYHTASKDVDEHGNVKVNYTQGSGDFKKLADQDENVTKEMEMMAIKEYKKIVKSGTRLTIDHIMTIRDKVKGMSR
jgi:DNA-binding Lrp family transcriptional regulator